MKKFEKARKRRPLPFIQPPLLKWDFIRDKAEEFRQRHVRPSDILPVPIIEIVELQLRIHPIPIIGLKEKIDVDGFLTKDLKNICIDYQIYMDQKQENRLRFTYAHEAGHYVLHQEEIRQCDFRTPENWVHFHEDFLEDDLNWFEQQAYEFAGRLLVPKDALIGEIEQLRPKIHQFRLMAGDDEENLIQAVSRIICKKFRVSAEVVFRRIKIEKAWLSE